MAKGLYHSRPGEAGTVFDVTRARSLRRSLAQTYRNLTWTLEPSEGDGFLVRISAHGTTQYLVEREPNAPVLEKELVT